MKHHPTSSDLLDPCYSLPALSPSKGSLLLLTMNKPAHHLFVCGSFRANGERQGVCHKKDSMSLLSYLQGEIQDRSLDGVEVAVTGCMNVCVKGPVMVDYPSGNYYRVPNNDAIDAILDAIENGTTAEEYLLT